MKILKELNKNIRVVSPVLVWDDEKFVYNPVNNLVIHEAKFVESEEEQRKRKLVAGYVVVTWQDNTTTIIPPLAGWEIQKRLEYSPAKNQFAARYQWFEDMAKKTLLRYSFKYLIAEIELDEKSQRILEIEQENETEIVEEKKISIENLLSPIQEQELQQELQQEQTQEQTQEQPQEQAQEQKKTKNQKQDKLL